MSEVTGAGGMDQMGAGVAVSEAASDCEQHLVFNFTWTREVANLASWVLSLSLGRLSLKFQPIK